MVMTTRGLQRFLSCIRGSSMIKKLAAALLVLLALAIVSEVYGKGQDSDCQPHSKDPDCAGK
jgi:hypothetical protein